MEQPERIQVGAYLQLVAGESIVDFIRRISESASPFGVNTIRGKHCTAASFSCPCCTVRSGTMDARSTRHRELPFVPERCRSRFRQRQGSKHHPLIRTQSLSQNFLTSRSKHQHHTPFTAFWNLYSLKWVKDERPSTVPMPGLPHYHRHGRPFRICREVDLEFS